MLCVRAREVACDFDAARRYHHHEPPHVRWLAPAGCHADHAVFQNDTLLGYIANRAHHAEIGGITPGSMPANATHLIQEGVVIAPRHLIRAGESCFDEISAQLTTALHPTRNLADNLADLHAQLAANLHGVERLRSLASESLPRVMSEILDHSAKVMRQQIHRLPDSISASEKLDDGSVIAVTMRKAADKLVLDFTGTSGVHPRNLNATNAIVRSAICMSCASCFRRICP